MMRLAALAWVCVLHVLLLATCEARGSNKRIPFICKIRKVDCSRRPDSVCCEGQSVAEDRLDVVEEEEEDYNETGDEDDAGYNNGDNLIQIASNIHEVVVKPNGDPVALQHNNDDSDSVSTATTTATTAAEVSESTTTVKSSNEKKIPKFCLKLKFNCKLLSFHPCCRHQAPASSKSTLVKVTQEKVEAPKELQQETVKKDEDEDNVKHEVKETAREKKPLFPQKGKNKSSSLFNNLRRKSSIFANPVKKSLFSNKRKPGKSGLCKIINCSRNKSHFCCKPDEVSEAEEKVEAEVVTEEPKKKDQIDAGEDKPKDNFNVDKNHVENASEGPSASKQTALESVTDDKVEDEDEITTMMSYGQQDEEEGQTTTAGTVINESDDEASGETLMSQEQSLDPHEADYDNNTESSTEFDELTTMMSYDGFTQMDEQDNTEAVTEFQTTEILTEIPSESFEEVTMVSKSKSESYEETRIWYDGINEKGEFVEKKDDKPYHVYTDANGETVVQVYPVYVPKQSFPVYNDIDNEVDNSLESEQAWYREDRDTGDIINEITCEKVDCLAWPGNKCCSPHVTKKRHSHEEDEINDKITATIVRIVKSVRWV